MMQENEGIAALKILVAVAKADGKLLDEERTALEGALAGVTLPDGITLDTLLKEEPDLEAQLQAITSPAAREEAYRAALSLAYADGECADAERTILDRMRFAFGLDEKNATLVQQIVAETKDTVLPTHIKKIDDPKVRSAEITEDTLKYAIMSAVLGAFPVPGLAVVTDVFVVGLQTKLVRDVGQYFGHTLDKQAAGTLLGGVVGGAGMRIAVNNLVKLVPGWGSVVGAMTSFATTWAIGRMAERYFESGGKAKPEDLKSTFTAAKKEGQAAYEKNKGRIDDKAKASKSVLAQLNEDLKAQKITQAEYDRRVSELV